jgi:hypothetical protein
VASFRKAQPLLFGNRIYVNCNQQHRQTKSKVWNAMGQKLKKPKPEEYSDILVLFLMRLQEVEERRYFKEFKYSIGYAEDGRRVTDGTRVDEEAFIAYLAVVRQLLIRKEICCLKNVQDILKTISNEHGLQDVIKNLESLDERWKKWKAGVVYKFSGGEVKLEGWELINFWLHDRYFHTATERLYLFYSIPADAVEISRHMMEVYTFEFVNHALAHRPIVSSVLAKGVVPKGSFGTSAFSQMKESDFNLPLRLYPGPPRTSA